VIEPEVTTTPAEVAEAPDTTTTKKQVEDPTKLEQSGSGEESTGGEGSGGRGSKKGKS
jgi:hypothetical protein